MPKPSLDNFDFAAISSQELNHCELLFLGEYQKVNLKILIDLKKLGLVEFFHADIVFHGVKTREMRPRLTTVSKRVYREWRTANPDLIPNVNFSGT